MLGVFYAAAELLATIFERAAIITPRESIAHDVAPVRGRVFPRRLARVQVLTLTELSSPGRSKSWEQIQDERVVPLARPIRA
ncbi:hypothetical protein JIR23_06730 [Bradyrhizobium diazoefficiens]|nr:hypothetical protein [Bradyrhizobium diazoefficiens]QQN65445.1 hypothetical protein JIR23_06730 [Bradyrhizobium diazoefficiens]